MNNRITGGGYEKTAAEYLEKQNIEVLYMNFRCKIGEIDIIGR
ncbi:MAG: YraN family protein, partial [Lachnospiraceae bacterium]|nr:YraN family protein [Lachnospiraceae bacterium]